MVNNCARASELGARGRGSSHLDHDCRALRARAYAATERFARTRAAPGVYDECLNRRTKVCLWLDFARARPEFIFMNGMADDIAHIIQLAVAPVFLIAGIGHLLSVLTSRLGRVVDRTRALEIELSIEQPMETHPRWAKELVLLDRRMAWINRAITLSTLAMLLVCLVIVTLFTGQLLAFDLSVLISVLFILTMGVLIAALGNFLWEIHVAAEMLQVRTDLLERMQVKRRRFF